MANNDWIEHLLVLVLAVLVCSLGLTIGDRESNDKWKYDAVRAGHAEYYIDAKHARQWRWLPVKHERK